MPNALTTAIDNRGTMFGPDNVADYVAYPPPSISDVGVKARNWFVKKTYGMRQHNNQPHSI
jgi:hypothetical protein